MADITWTGYRPMPASFRLRLAAAFSAPLHEQEPLSQQAWGPPRLRESAALALGRLSFVLFYLITFLVMFGAPVAAVWFGSGLLPG